MLISLFDKHLRSVCPFGDGSHAGGLVAAAAARRRADGPPVEFWDFSGPLGLAWSYSSLDGTFVCRADWTAQRFIRSVRTYPPGTPADPFFSVRSSRQPDLRLSQADGAKGGAALLRPHAPADLPAVHWVSSLRWRLL